MKVLFVSAEVAPLAKVGGLADVAGALPAALNKLGVDTRVIMPLYKRIRDNYGCDLKFMRWTMIKLGWRTMYSGLFRMDLNGVTHYFIDNEYYFGHDAIYLDYDFDIERYCFFQRAVLEAMGAAMDFVPDIIHCNDWQTGLIPALLQAHYHPYGYFNQVKCFFTIHNLKYQGVHSFERIADYCDLSTAFLNDYGILKDGVPNMMKAGIVYADQVTTVSPTYAEEIKQPYYGEGLDGVLSYYSFKLKGILNGIDCREYNPATDSHLVRTYSSSDVKEGKAANKAALQAELGLNVEPDRPLLAMITRMVDQKGMDLLLRVLGEIAGIPTQVVVLGTGEHRYEEGTRICAGYFKENIRACLTFDNALAHRIYAAADIFLMPSLFEPCGLSQLIAMNYGTLPVVRETGGLKDTVTPYNQYTMEGNGFSFTNINAHDFLNVVRNACDLYNDSRDIWDRLVQNAMHKDVSWQKSAECYKELYEGVLNRKD